VQSALLEAMQELQITIGETTFTLDRPFLVLATQNPIEQEGTYPLPEAQIDRFMMKVRVDYPSAEEEREIMTRVYGGMEARMTGVIDFCEWTRLCDASGRENHGPRYFASPRYFEL